MDQNQDQNHKKKIKIKEIQDKVVRKINHMLINQRVLVNEVQF